MQTSRPVTITVPHKLGRQEARRRLEGAAGQIRTQLSGIATVTDEMWVGDTLTFRIAAMAQTVTGRIDVMEEQVVVELELPWMLSMLAEKLKGKISRQGSILLEDKRPEKS